jgi:prephenate dehydrogenase
MECDRIVVFKQHSYTGHIISAVIKYVGILATVLGFITVVPSMHDAMVAASSILTLLLFFYIMVMVIKSKLSWLKVMSILFMLTLYFAAYMYFTRSFLLYMPIMQKVIFLMKIVWILSLEYCTGKEDFEYITK